MFPMVVVLINLSVVFPQEVSYRISILGANNSGGDVGGNTK